MNQKSDDYREMLFPESDEQVEINSRELGEMWSKIKVLRKARGFTQKQLGDRAMITQGAISKIEKGDLLPGHDNQVALARELGIVRGSEGQIVGDVIRLTNVLYKLAFHPDTIDVKDIIKPVNAHPSQYEEYLKERFSDDLNNDLDHPKFEEVIHNFIKRAVSGELSPQKIETGSPKVGQPVIRESRGKSLLNYSKGGYGEGGYGAGPYGGKPPTPTIPRYFREAPRDFDLWGAVHWGGSQDNTPRPPMLDDVKGGYAVQLNTNHMSPRYGDGDTLYINPELHAYYSDDVAIQLLYQKKFYTFVTRVLKMERFYSKDNREWLGYGCMSYADEDALVRDAIDEGWDQDEFESERDKAMDWFLFPDTPEMFDLERDMHDYPDGLGGEHGNALMGCEIHVVVGCERKRMADRLRRSNPRMKRQLEADQDAERYLTPRVPERPYFSQEEQDEIDRDLSKDLED